MTADIKYTGDITATSGETPIWMLSDLGLARRDRDIWMARSKAQEADLQAIGEALGVYPDFPSADLASVAKNIASRLEIAENTLAMWRKPEKTDRPQGLDYDCRTTEMRLVDLEARVKGLMTALGACASRAVVNGHGERLAELEREAGIQKQRISALGKRLEEMEKAQRIEHRTMHATFNEHQARIDDLAERLAALETVVANLGTETRLAALETALTGDADRYGNLVGRVETRLAALEQWQKDVDRQANVLLGVAS